MCFKGEIGALCYGASSVYQGYKSLSRPVPTLRELLQASNLI